MLKVGIAVASGDKEWGMRKDSVVNSGKFYVLHLNLGGGHGVFALGEFPELHTYDSCMFL